MLTILCSTEWQSTTARTREPTGIRSLVRWFVGSLVRWFVGSLVRWFVGSLVARTACDVWLVSQLSDGAEEVFS